MRPQRIALAVTVALFAVAGCGGDPADEADPSEGGDPSAESSPEDAAGSPDDEDTDGSPDDEAGGQADFDPDDADQVAALMQRAESAAFHVVFEAADPAAGDFHQVVAQDPPRFSWHQSDGERDERTFAQHYVVEDDGAVVSCVWLGDVDDEDINEWECAREQASEADPALFSLVFGEMLFGSQAYPVGDIAAAGWEPGEQTEIAGREAVCGFSPAFADAVTEVCVDAATGVPLAVERDDVSGTAVEFRDPVDDDFAPPGEPWEASDADN